MTQAELNEFASTDPNDENTTTDDWQPGETILFRNVVTTVIETIDDTTVAVESPTVDGGRLEADREHLAEPHNPGTE